MPLRRRRGSCLAAICLYASNKVSAVLPTAQLIVKDGDGSGYAALGSFGPLVPEASSSPWLTVALPSGPRDACDGTQITPFVTDTMMIAERGTCSFATKALNAQGAGAKALVVVNTLEAVYAGRSYAEPTLDYECENGEGWIKSVAEPVWDPMNTDTACSSNARCTSGRCMVTNSTDVDFGTKVCCAWDLFMTMGADKTLDVSSLAIPVVFMTMAEGEELIGNPLLETGTLQAQLYDRPRDDTNISSFLIWALGCITASYAAWSSASEERQRAKKRRHGPGAIFSPGGTRRSSDQSQDESMELTMAHALGFIVMASTLLLALFFLNLTTMVTFMYCISAGTSLAAVVLVPSAQSFVNMIGGKCLLMSKKRFNMGSWGDMLVLEAVCVVFALALAIWWAVMRFSAPLMWVLQDMFGCSLCVAFLSGIRVSSLRVAAALLCMAFVYDIFWVFLSPYLFSESVMVEVATGGGITEDPTICEKYPDTDGCTAFTLPMLLELPRFNDYQGGSVMLGLGDIVLPGLLLSFAARYDAATELALRKGYFLYLCGGYAVGLAAANTAVMLTGMGQPALLYLVPSTLGLLCLIAYTDGALRTMWFGPPCLMQESIPTSSSDAVANSDVEVLGRKEEVRSLLSAAV